MMYRHKQQLSFWHLVYISLECLIEQDWKGYVRRFLKRQWANGRQAVTLTLILDLYLFFWSTTKCIISHATVNQNKSGKTVQSDHVYIYIYISKKTHRTFHSFEMLTKRITVSNSTNDFLPIGKRWFSFVCCFLPLSLEILSQVAWSFSRKAWPFVFLVITISFACRAVRFVFSSFLLLLPHSRHESIIQEALILR